jgi:hypothetical protein
VETVDRRKRTDVVECPDAPARDDRDGGRGHGGGQPGHVGTGERPVACDVGDDERRGGGEPAERIGQSHVTRRRPTVHGEHAAPVIEADGHRHDGGDLLDDSRRTHRRRTHHDAADAGVGQCLRRVDRARPPAHLDRHGRWDGIDDRFDDGPVHRLARERGVEVDDVDPTRSLLAETGRHRDGFIRVHGLERVVAPPQPDDPTATDVDRRVQHRGHRSAHRKLANKRFPSAADFSGWNWVAKTLPRRNAAFTAPP